MTDSIQYPRPITTDLWIVTYQGYPVRFVRNHQRTFTVCHLDDATTFATEDDAHIKIVDWPLRGNPKFKVRRQHLEP